MKINKGAPRQASLQERLRSLADAAGIRNADLARIAGVSAVAAGKWFSAGQTPKAGQLLKIARYFSVQIEWLLSGEGPRASSGEGDRGLSQAAAAKPHQVTIRELASPRDGCHYSVKTPLLSAGMLVATLGDARAVAAGFQPADGRPVEIREIPAKLLACPFCRRADRLQRVCTTIDRPGREGSECLREVECLRCEASAPEAAWQGRQSSRPGTQPA